MKYLILVLAFLSTVSLAGVTATVTPGPSVLHPGDGTPSVNFTGPSAGAQCDDAAKKIVGKSTCSDVRYITGVGTCADVAKPVWPRELDANGYVTKPAFRSKVKEGSDTEYTHEVEDYVPGAGYPECWVKGWRVAMESDFTDDDDTLLANSIEPVQWTAELQALWDSAESCARRHDNHIVYSEDTCT